MFVRFRGKPIGVARTLKQRLAGKSCDAQQAKLIYFIGFFF